MKLKGFFFEFQLNDNEKKKNTWLNNFDEEGIGKDVFYFQLLKSSF